MTRKTINKLIGFGILIFLAEFFLGFSRNSYFKWLIPVGTIMTFVGVFFFFKTTNLSDEFRKDESEDILTYFWNVIILKFWTLIFILWMIAANVTLLFSIVGGQKR